jgi:hypothetical protein
LQQGDIASIGAATTRNFYEPLQTIVPWASNLYTETLIAEVRREFGDSFWGFWMLGGMSGGGMGFIFEPSRKKEAQDALQRIMSQARRRFESALPFAMEPVVYDFAINERGTCAELLDAESAPLPTGYYAMTVPNWCALTRANCRRRAALNSTLLLQLAAPVPELARHGANALRPFVAPATESAKAAGKI